MVGRFGGHESELKLLKGLRKRWERCGNWRCGIGRPREAKSDLHFRSLLSAMHFGMFVPFQGKRKGWQLTQFVGASNRTFWEIVGRNMALIACQKTVDLRETESDFWRWKDLEETRVSWRDWRCGNWIVEWKSEGTRKSNLHDVPCSRLCISALPSFHLEEETAMTTEPIIRASKGTFCEAVDRRWCA